MKSYRQKHRIVRCGGLSHRAATNFENFTYLNENLFKGVKGTTVIVLAQLITMTWINVKF